MFKVNNRDTKTLSLISKFLVGMSQLSDDTESSMVNPQSSITNNKI